MKLGLFFLVVVCLLHTAAGCEQLVQGALQLRNFARNTTDYSYKYNVRQFLNTFGLNIEDDQEIKLFLCDLYDSNVKTITDMWHRGRGVRGTEAEVAMGYMRFMSTFTFELKWEKDRLKETQKQKDFLDDVGYPNFPLKKSSADIADLVAKMDEYPLRDLFPNLIDWGEDYGSGVFDTKKLITALTSSESLLDFANAIYPYELYSSDDLTQHLESMFRHVEQNSLSVKMHESFKALMEQYGLTTITRGGPEKFSCESLAEEAISLYAKIKKLVGGNLDILRDTLHMQYPPSVLQLDDDIIRLYICQFFDMKTVKDLPPFINTIDYYHASLGIVDTLNRQDKAINFLNKALKGVLWSEQTGFPDFPLKVTETQAREVVETLDRDFSDPARKETWVKAIMESKSLAEFRMRPDYSDYFIDQIVGVVTLLKGKVELLETTYFDLVRFVGRIEEYGLLMLPE